jgi:hypothetical protein
MNTLIAQMAYVITEDKALKAGCYEYLSKSVKGHALLSTISKQLSNKYVSQYLCLFKG